MVLSSYKYLEKGHLSKILLKLKNELSWSCSKTSSVLEILSVFLLLSAGAYNVTVFVEAASRYMYSRTSDNGPSEKRTTALQQTSVVLRIVFSIVVILTQPPRSGRFLIPDSGQDSGSQLTFSIQICL